MDNITLIRVVAGALVLPADRRSHHLAAQAQVDRVGVAAVKPDISLGGRTPEQGR